jgi:hypothetical protein
VSPWISSSTGLCSKMRTPGTRQTRFAQHQIQRVQIGAHVDQAAGVRASPPPGGCWGRPAGLMAVAQAPARLFVLERRELRRGVGQFAKPQRRSQSMPCSAMRWPTSPPSRYRRAPDSARRPRRRTGKPETS